MVKIFHNITDLTVFLICKNEWKTFHTHTHTRTHTRTQAPEGISTPVV